MRLCLNMIVRNESQIILRALETVADVIDHWVICDTGSNDGTPELIQSWMDSRGIPGEMHHFEFENFGSARNRALDAARQSAGDFDYILLMDADMKLVVDRQDFAASLDAAAYQMLQRSGTLSYWNVRLVRRDVPSRYVGVTHEYLDVPADRERLDGVWFLDGADGANRPGKFERDIALLQQGLEAEPDNARYMFYLAQSFRDAGRYQEALRWYRRRAEMGGWEEEAWYASLQAARCLRSLGDMAGFRAAAAAAFQMRPHRAEPLYDLALSLREAGQYEAAMGFCELATHIPWPAQDQLFVEDYVYRDGIRQEIAICGYYCASDQRKQAGRYACNSLAIDPDALPEVRNKARENLVYYSRRADELFASPESRRLDFSTPDGWIANNPSILATDGGYLCVIRLVNFTTPDGVHFDTLDGGPVRTRNLLFELDADLGETRRCELTMPADLPPPKYDLVQGIEDMRLVSRGEDLLVAGTYRQNTPEGWCEMVLARVGECNDGVRGLGESRILSVGGARRHEKNWMPVCRNGELSFVYSCDPTRLVDATGRTISESRPIGALDHLRGGSQLVPFDGGWLALTHEVVVLGNGRHYLHRFVWFDADFGLRRVTEPFSFSGQPIEFAAGLAWDIEGDRLLASYGVMDSQCWIAAITAAAIRKALQSSADAPLGGA